MIIRRKKLIEKLKTLQKETRNSHKGLIEEKDDYFKGLNRGFEDGNDNAYNYLISLIKNKII
jgi:hypothetical protein